MATLSKKNLHMMGSAINMEHLKNLIMERLYWSRVDATECEHTSRLGKCYAVGNAKGIFSDMVIIEGKRCSLYRIKLNRRTEL